MQNVFFQYLAVLVPFVVIDGIWLSTMAPRFYQKYIGNLLAATPNWTAAVVFYLLYMVGIVALVVNPAIAQNQTLGKVILMGAIFGGIAYATYDLTNQATLKEWSTVVTVVDIIWGAILTGSVSVIAVWALRSLLG